MNFLSNNYEWFFSGLGVFFISLLFSFYTKKKNNNKTKGNNSPIINGDNNIVQNVKYDKENKRQ